MVLGLHDGLLVAKPRANQVKTLMEKVARKTHLSACAGHEEAIDWSASKAGGPKTQARQATSIWQTNWQRSELAVLGWERK